jgi:hypothetical protein
MPQAAVVSSGTLFLRQVSSMELITGVLHGAIDVRVYSRVIERAGQDCNRRCSCPAAVDGSFVIAALPGGEAADDQPYDKNCRSDVHLDPLGQPIAMAAFTLSGISGEAYPYVAILGPVHVNPMHFPETWKSSRQ